MYKVQGYGRRQRGLVFYKYLTNNYPGIKRLQNVTIVPGCGHDYVCMFHSLQFKSAWEYLNSRGSAV